MHPRSPLHCARIVDHLRKADGNIEGVDTLAAQLEADVKRLAEEEAALASKLEQMKGGCGACKRGLRAS